MPAVPSAEQAIQTPPRQKVQTRLPAVMAGDAEDPVARQARFVALSQLAASRSAPPRVSVGSRDSAGHVVSPTSSDKKRDAAIQVAAAIQEANSGTTRASPRLAGVTDSPVLDRAKKRAAWKNLEPGEGKMLSFVSLPDHSIASKIINRSKLRQ